MCRFDDRGFPDGRYLAASDIHHGELGSRVVFEQILIVRILEHVFVRYDGSAAAQTLLDVRTLGNRRLRGRRAATCANRVDEHRLSVGHPLHASAATSAPETAAGTASASTHHGVDAQPFDTM